MFFKEICKKDEEQKHRAVPSEGRECMKAVSHLPECNAVDGERWTPRHFSSAILSVDIR